MAVSWDCIKYGIEVIVIWFIISNELTYTEPIEGHPYISPDMIIQRPKVVYSEATGQYHVSAMMLSPISKLNGLRCGGMPIIQAMVSYFKVSLHQIQLLDLIVLLTQRHRLVTGVKTSAYLPITRMVARMPFTQMVTYKMGVMCTSPPTTKRYPL